MEVRALVETTDEKRRLPIALSPDHSQFLFCSRGEKPQLRDKIWEWPGDEARLPIHKTIVRSIVGLHCTTICPFC